MNREREYALEVVRTLRRAGHQALWAGGCVRDMLLGLEPDDYDVATDAKPDLVCKLFRRTIEVGASFGVVEVLGPRVEGVPLKVQVATFRTDSSYSDGRHPDSVQFTTAEGDAQRRDFTLNGMFFDPLENRVIDYVGGQADLQARVLRAIGNPNQRFTEDKLRLLRGIRMAARFDLTIEPKTEDAIRDMARQVRVVSAERISEEFRKMLLHPRRVRALRLALQLGLLEPILWEVLPMTQCPQGQPEAPTGTLWEHTMQVLDRLQEPSFALSLAALLHDVGKPRTIARLADRYTFYHHEHVGMEMSTEIARRFRLSNDDRDRLVFLVEKHQYLADARRMKTSKLKSILAHPGIHELLRLHRADALASGRSLDHVEYCENLITEWSAEDLNPPPLLTGHDLIRHGHTPGPHFKQILDRVREEQLEGTLHNPKDAWEVAKRLLEEMGATER
jgi:poly(A) polymerase